MVTAAAAALLVDKREFWHTSVNLVPKFAFETTQWPLYDEIVYQSILWDREYFITAGITFDFTIEFAHMAYYKLSAQFNFLQVGFGIQDILFEETPSHYCSLYYLDGRALETSIAFETNTKPCTLASSKMVDSFGWHWDSRSSTQPNES